MVVSLVVGALAATTAVGGSAAAKVCTHAGLVALSASASVSGGSAVAKASATLTTGGAVWGFGHGAYGCAPWAWNACYPYIGKWGYTSCLPWTWNTCGPWYCPPPFYP